MEKLSLIENTFPAESISINAKKEKNIRHGHVSTLHQWWSRKPLGSSRAICFSALAKSDKHSEETIFNLTNELGLWENNQNMDLLNQAREILASQNSESYKILDPFAGGGSIPLQAMHLGIESHALDLNPVSTILLKATLEYPSMFSRKKGFSLVNDIEKWQNWIIQNNRDFLSAFYPSSMNGKEFCGYYWVKTIVCPECNQKMPLVSNWWLANKNKRKIFFSLKLIENNLIATIHQSETIDISQCNPSIGTMKSGKATCPHCNFEISSKQLKKIFQNKKNSQEPIIKIFKGKKNTPKEYFPTEPEDLTLYKKTSTALDQLHLALSEKWGFPAIPMEKMNQSNSNTLAGRGFGISSWGQIFNLRQLLSLLTFSNSVELAYQEMLHSGYPTEYAKAITLYLGLSVNRIASSLSELNRWQPTFEKTAKVPDGQKLPMIYNYMEANPLSEMSAGWKINCRYLLKAIDYCLYFTDSNENIPVVKKGTATKLPYENQYFDAVITDPPYYDCIDYAELSDFFYIWLKRSIGWLFPEWLSSELVEKNSEIVPNLSRHGSKADAKKHFHENLAKSFSEISRVLKDQGIGVIIYAQNSPEGWLPLVESLVEAGLQVVKTYSLSTEYCHRLGKSTEESLDNSIYIIVKKITKSSTPQKSQKKLLKQIENQKLLKKELEMNHSTRFNESIAEYLPYLCEVYRENKEMASEKTETIMQNIQNSFI